MSENAFTPRMWRYARDKDDGKYVPHAYVWGPTVNVHASGDLDDSESDMLLIAAAPELHSVASNFEVTGPDADGLVWLVLHGNGTSGKGMVNLGAANTLVAQVALCLEQDRRAALAKARGEA